jgi:hypothetical protein
MRNITTRDVTQETNPDPERATSPLPRASVKPPLPPKSEPPTSINNAGKNQKSEIPSQPPKPAGASSTVGVSFAEIKAASRRYGGW